MRDDKLDDEVADQVAADTSFREFIAAGEPQAVRRGTAGEETEAEPKAAPARAAESKPNCDHHMNLPPKRGSKPADDDSEPEPVTDAPLADPEADESPAGQQPQAQTAAGKTPKDPPNLPVWGGLGRDAKALIERGIAANPERAKALMDDEEAERPSASSVGFGRVSYEKFNFSNEMQDCFLACFVRYPDQFAPYTDVLRPQYFNGVDACEVAFALKDYVEEFGNYPNFSTLMNWVYQKFERSNADKASQLVDYVLKLTELDTADWKGIRKLMVSFHRERALFAALREIHAKQMDGRGGQIDPRQILEDALRVDRVGRATITTLDDALAATDDPPEALIEGVLPVGGLLVMAGRAKSQKTWTAIDAAISTAAGGHWLGHECKPAKTVFVNFELSPKELAKRIKWIAKAKGIDLATLRDTEKAATGKQPAKVHDRFIALTINSGEIRVSGRQEPHENLYAGAVMSAIKAEVNAKMPDAQFLFLDSFYNLCGNINENDASAVKLVYRYIRTLGRSLGGATIGLVHHFSKGDPGTKMEGERGAGSRVHRQEPDAYVELTPHQEEDAVSVHIELRSYRRISDFCLKWAHPLLVDAPDLNPKDIKKASGRKPEHTAQDLFKLLPPEGLANKNWMAVAAKAGIGRSLYYELRAELNKAGQIVQTGEMWQPEIA